MGLDKSKDYSTIHGLPGIAYEQDGRYYSADLKPVQEVSYQVVEDPKPESKEEPVVFVEPTWQCTTCGKEFEKKSAYLMHLRRSHK